MVTFKFVVLLIPLPLVVIVGTVQKTKQQPKEGKIMDKRLFTRNHIEDREVDEVIGICRGMLADGEVNFSEGKFLLSWLERNTGNLGKYPFNVLHERLVDILSGGTVDDDEQLELIDLFMSVIGTPVVNTREKTELDNRASAPAMPYTQDDIPEVKGKTFTLTGEFELAKRAEVVVMITLQGGFFSKNLTKNTEYLVIGKIGSEHWKHSSFGRKIEKAMKYKDEGVAIEVIGEEHLTVHFK